MKRSSHYYLAEIEQIPYLLPFGQNLADFKKSMQLNSTGVFLWNQLEKQITFEELLHNAASYFHAEEEDLVFIRQDIEQFLKILRSYGMLEEEEIFPDLWEERLSLSIGGLKLSFLGSKGDFSPEFLAFQDNFTGVPDQTLRVLYYPPSNTENGTLLIRNHELMVMDAEDKYIITFPASPYIREAWLSKNGKDVIFYCQGIHTPTSQEQLFHAIRLMFLYLAQQHNMVVLHSASLLYKGKAWLFSGSSGTGKSTHTNLWKEYEQISLLNGDLNLIAMENGIPVVCGLPWCGTSKINTTHTYPLGGITLLGKSPENHVEALSSDKKVLLVTQRLISPAWTSTQLQRNLSVITEIVPHILVTKLHCTKEKEAVDTIKKEIDSFILLRIDKK